MARTKKTKTQDTATQHEAQLLLLDPGRYEQPRLIFEDGALVLKAVRHEQTELALPDYFVWHAGHWVAPAYRYADLRQWLAEGWAERNQQYTPLCLSGVAKRK